MSIALIGLIQNLDIRMNKFLYCYLTGVYTQDGRREGNIEEKTIRLSAKILTNILLVYLLLLVNLSKIGLNGGEEEQK